jgi:hypothetical protein
VDHGEGAAEDVDPDGGGLLTEYGRAQGETLLRTRYGSGSAEDEVGPVKDFLWGLFRTPDWLLLGGSLRPAALFMKMEGQPMTTDFLLMEADLRVGIRAGGFRASASAGAISTDASLASIAGPFVSREYWAGYAWGDDAFEVRAGRMNLPFGVRSIEHTLWVRASTRTDLNDGQEHGVAFDYNGELLRGSLMAVLGNYQISPDEFRERGYVGYLEAAPSPRVAIGVSSLVTHAAKDIVLQVEDTRQAHGAYVRAAPWKPLVLMAEGDFIVSSTPTSAASSVGFASMVQADVEPVQGLHLIATGESLSPGGVAPQSSFGAWGAIHWFFAPHADARVDFMYRSMAVGSAASSGTTGASAAGPSTPSIIPVTACMVQLHAYL